MINRIGPHAITCANIADPVVDMLISDVPLGVLYSDPPWGDGNVKFWATLAKKDTGVNTQVLTYDQLLGRVMQLAEKVSGHIFIETGPRWVTMVQDMFQQAYGNARAYEMLYPGGKKMLTCWLVVSSNDGSGPYRGFNPTGMHGAKVPRECVLSVRQPGRGLLDPCCGMGYSARAAIAAGMVFRGNELNAKRLAKTAAFLGSTV